MIKNRYPDVQIQLSAKNHVAIMDALMNAEIDMGISHESAIQTPAGCKTCIIGTSNSIFVISSQNPLAEKPDLTLADLRDEPFYCVSPANDENHSHSTHLIRLCSEKGFIPNIVPVSSSSEAYIRMQGKSGVFLTVSWDRATTSSLYRTVVSDSKQNIVAVWRDEPNGIIDESLSKEIMRHYRNRDVNFFKNLMK